MKELLLLKNHTKNVVEISFFYILSHVHRDNCSNRED